MQKVVELEHIELLVLVEIWCSFLTGGQQSELLFLVELAFRWFPCSVVKLILISFLHNSFVSGFLKLFLGGNSALYSFIWLCAKIWKWNVDSISVKLYACVLLCNTVKSNFMVPDLLQVLAWHKLAVVRGIMQVWVYTVQVQVCYSCCLIVFFLVGNTVIRYWWDLKVFL